MTCPSSLSKLQSEPELGLLHLVRLLHTISFFSSFSSLCCLFCAMISKNELDRLRQEEGVLAGYTDSHKKQLSTH